jgi:hypothetical protein
MTNSNIPLRIIESIEAALRILAYNTGGIFQNSGVHDKDFKTIQSLADAPYAWTEKQANLAMMFLKRYKTLLNKFGFDTDELINNPRYDQPFRVISFEKSIDTFTAEDGREILEMRFPYNEKIIALIRCLKKKTQELVPMLYDGEIKKWTMNYTDTVAYYATLIAVRYDFKILKTKILEDYEEIKQEKKKYQPVVVNIDESSVRLINAPESLAEHWQEHCQSLPYIKQRDQLKQLNVSSVRNNSLPANTLAEKIAYSLNTNLFVDRKTYDKKTLLEAIIELGDLPAICPFSGDIQSKEEIVSIHEWLKTFESVGILQDNIAFGFEFDRPVNIDPVPEIEQFPSPDFFYGTDTPMEERKKIYEDWKELYEFSASNRKITATTKIIFVRNKIPRTLLKSGIKPRVAFMLQDYPRWPLSTNTLDKLVESLPKRLYYMSQMPSDIILQSI